MITLKINDRELSVEEGTTVLEAARAAGIRIPTLCYMNLSDLGMVHHEANCRVCVVEQVGRRNLVPACATVVTEGMEIHTNTLRVLRARRTIVELILSNHPKSCLICPKSGQCELQALAEEVGVREVRYQGKVTGYTLDKSSYSLVRDPNKCILCQRCVTMCNEVQTVSALTDVHRGFDTIVSTFCERPIINTTCTFCGRCLAVCPTGAISERTYTAEVYRALSDPEKTVVVQTAPSVRVALGEAFGMEAGTSVTGKMVTALRRIGFDRVFDTDFAADLTVMEEASEFVHRLKEGGTLPILTSCCPAWVKFMEHNFPDLLGIPSSCKSPHEMFGSVMKTHYAEKIGVSPDKIVVVSVMPCVAKKFESNRPELTESDKSDVDYVITTRELAQMIKDFALDFPNLPESEFDSPLGESTGAGVIFGQSGGVMEASLRTAYHLLKGEDLETIEFEELHGLEGIKEGVVHLGDMDLSVAVASGLGNARKILDGIRAGTSKYDIIEVMACQGGCINGAGQPYTHANVDILRKRREAIVREDRGKEIRYSYKNPEIQKLYREYLGEPYGERAKALLHTGYTARSKI